MTNEINVRKILYLAISPKKKICSIVIKNKRKDIRTIDILRKSSTESCLTFNRLYFDSIYIYSYESLIRVFVDFKIFQKV